MKFKNPLTDYKKNNTIENFILLKRAEDYVLNFITTNRYMDFQDYQLQQTAEQSNILGYYLDPEFIYMFLTTYFKQKAQIKLSSVDLQSCKDKVLQNILAKEIKENAEFNIEDAVVEQGIYHVAISFEHAPMTETFLRDFLLEIRKHCQQETARIIFYIADNVFNEVPNMSDKESKSLETLLLTLQEHRPVLHNISKKNKTFEGILQKFNMVTENLIKFSQKNISSDVYKTLKENKVFFNPILFKMFLKTFCKNIKMIYKIVTAPQNPAMLQYLLDLNTTNPVVFLNTEALKAKFPEQINKKDHKLNIETPFTNMVDSLEKEFPILDNSIIDKVLDVLPTVLRTTERTEADAFSDIEQYCQDLEEDLEEAIEEEQTTKMQSAQNDNTKGGFDSEELKKKMKIKQEHDDLKNYNKFVERKGDEIKNESIEKVTDHKTVSKKFKEALIKYDKT